ncbi:MAG: hypothetical protein MJ084_03710 [Saccharofermentans sp.]|nr:hypothetical protein [Saccharofermentans sp.]
MNISTPEHLKSRINLLNNTINMLNIRIASFPSGSLAIRHTRTRVMYYHYSSGNNTKYISKSNTTLISQLAQKRYLQHTLKIAMSELAALNEALDKYPAVAIEEAYDSFDEKLQKYITPIVPGDDQYVIKWLETPYKKKPIKPGSKTYTTLKGEIVRSKSEALIADRLYARGIPYKYECPVPVDGEVLHPDFKILKLSTKNEVYLEHCGMMDDPEYTKEMVVRSRKLAKAGITEGNNLFYTFETAEIPLDLDQLDEMIERNFR